MKTEKQCYYCIEKDDIIDYKLPRALNYYISAYKKILPRRYTRLCTKHQRQVKSAIKLGRQMGFMPYVRAK